MPKIDGKEFSREVLAKVMLCDTPEALMKLAEEHGVKITKEEAEAFLAEIEDVDLDSNELKKVAGGGTWLCGKHTPCRSYCRKEAWM